MRRNFLCLILSLVLVFGLFGQAGADTIYVLGNTHSKVTAARNNLTALGNTVVFGGGTTLSDYSAYDQVWDLRYNVNLGAADLTAMGSYLAGGGRMYLTGEHSGFDSTRNVSLANWVSNIGGGSLTLSGSGSSSQVFTTDGQFYQLDSNPNSFTSIAYSAARSTSTAGTGFLVTENYADAGVGSLVGWDFGDITGKSDARMLVGFDIEIFQNGPNWTENMYTFLAEAAPVPEPATMLLLGSGLVGIAGFRRKKFKK